MIANLVVIAGVALIAYLWSAQGAFSALVHLACTLVAGAVAFAVWEPVTTQLLLGVQEDVAWSAGLIGPFVVTLFVLRLLTNKLVSANMKLTPAANLVGGLLFGAVSGVVTMGIVVVGIGHMRIPAQFMGYNPVGYDPQGNLVVSEGSKLWLPVDALTVKLYERLSEGALASSTPLARALPAAHLLAGEMRYVFGDGSRRLARVAFKPGDVEVVGRYEVRADSPRELFADTIFTTKDGEPIPQQVRLPDGSTPPAGTTLVGYLLKFNPGAREKEGQVVIGPGQIRLIAEQPDGSTIVVHPVAVVARAEGKSLQASRFRFDAPDVFIASVGGASESQMAFEFPLPPGAKPRWLMVKRLRLDVSQTPALPVAQEAALTPQGRDQAIRAGAILGGGVDVASLDKSDAETVRTVGDDFRPDELGVLITPSLGGRAFRAQDKGGLELNSDNEIVNGENTFSPSAFDTRGVSRDLLVEKFAEDAQTRIVQVDVSMDQKHSILGRTFQMVENILPPALVDTLGQRYEPVGWIFDDGQRVQIRFTPGRPVRALVEIPQLSRSKPNQRLRLIFRVTRGVDLQAFTLGDRVLVEYTPPLRVN